MRCVDVILPLPLSQTFTYSVPDELAARMQPGVRVIVPFGRRKFYSALVETWRAASPDIDSAHRVSTVKEIVAALDDEPVVNHLQMQFWKWIASYYMCSIGEVMKAAIPAGLKLESETQVFYNEAYVQCEELNKHEEEVLNLLHDKKKLPISEISAACKHKNLMRTVQSLVDKEALQVEEVIASRYKPKFEACVSLHPDIDSEEKLKATFEILEKAPKQLEILMNFVRLSGVFSCRPNREPSKKELLQAGEAHAEALNSLFRKKILESSARQVSRLDVQGSAHGARRTAFKSPGYGLNVHQNLALKQIREAFAEKSVALLHGVTSSGKTEIYIRLIDEQLQQGRQVLYLLPEIALTAQIINRLRAVFGSRVGIYHSKFPDAERVEVWNHIGKKDGYSVVLGVRSSVFLPFSNLGLVIVDEEHENTYKQFDPAPRYHARDAAIVLASLHGAKTLLGTATPAIESYYNACQGKYGLVELMHRYAGLELPETLMVDTALARKQKAMKSLFHPELLAAIEETLKSGKQAILFQNRRGYAPYVQCRVCEHVPRCELCDVSLTYHKFSDRLLCHYCGYSAANMRQCPACGGLDIGDVGFGTEKIEDELQVFFPQAKIARLDLDSTGTRSRYENIIESFAQGKTDILVGTQMVTKGLDFDNVQLSAVLNADTMLRFPDFRACERCYQLLTQVGGRAGRAGKRGKAIIQASKPQHPTLQQVVAGDYAGMYASQLSEREKFKYPPFYRLIRLSLKHKSKNIVHSAAKELADYLTQIFGDRVLGPETPVVSRVKTYHIENILLKIEKQASLQKVKSLLSEAIGNVRRLPDYKSLFVVADVDPV